MISLATKGIISSSKSQSISTKGLIDLKIVTLRLRLIEVVKLYSYISKTFTVESEI